MRSSFYLLIFTAVVIGLSLPAGAQTPATEDNCDAAKKLVEKFLKLDADIGRLSSEIYKKHFDAMIVYKINGKIVHEEPAWDTVTVIRGFKINDCRSVPAGFQGQPTYNVRVSYESYGHLTHGSAQGQCPLFTPKKTKLEEDDFEVLKVKNELRIRLAPPPHVTTARGLQWVETSSRGCLQEKAKAKRQIQSAERK